MILLGSSISTLRILLYRVPIFSVAASHVFSARWLTVSCFMISASLSGCAAHLAYLYTLLLMIAWSLTGNRLPRRSVINVSISLGRGEFRISFFALSVELLEPFPLRKRFVHSLIDPYSLIRDFVLCRLHRVMEHKAIGRQPRICVSSQYTTPTTHASHDVAITSSGNGWNQDRLQIRTNIGWIRVCPCFSILPIDWWWCTSDWVFVGWGWLQFYHFFSRSNSRSIGFSLSSRSIGWLTNHRLSILMV